MGFDEATAEVAARARMQRDRAPSYQPAIQSCGVGDDCFEIVIERQEDEIARRLSSVTSEMAATVFQSERWLRAWYATIGRTVGVPLLVTVIDRRTNELAVMLPLIARDSGRLRIVEFADQGVCDANAPILGPSAPTNATQARKMWRAVRAAFIGADFLQLTKMPGEIEGRVNPLTLLPWAAVGSTTDHVLTIDGSFDSYLSSLSGALRKSMRKSQRVLCGREGAEFQRIENADEAARVLAALEHQQAARLRAQGPSFRLNEPEFSAFYGDVIAKGVANGSVVLTALMRQEDVVAALLGLARGSTYVMVRISVSAQQPSGCSPGLLLIAQTMQMLHARSTRIFDFSIGDYPYKRRLGARSRALFNLNGALTVRGIPRFAWLQAKHALRQSPTLHGLAQRLRQSSERRTGKTVENVV